MSECTWVDCKAEAAHPQIALDKSQWANLCNEHHEQLGSAVANMGTNYKAMVGAWIKAQGGSKAAAKRVRS